MAVDFGREMSCTDRLRTAQFVTGPRLVAEAMYRRFRTPRGTLRGGEEEENYGLDLTELVGSVSSKSDAAALRGRITNEAKKDERVLTVSVTVILTTKGPSTSLDIQIVGNTAAGPFTLKLRASELDVELLGIKADN